MASARSTKSKPRTRIPAALRQNVWLHHNGKNFEAKCAVTWCQNTINAFSFEAGHNIPDSKGGETTLDNLRPICQSCNRSMGNRYTIDEFNALQQAPTPPPPTHLIGNNRVHPEPQPDELIDPPPPKCGGWFCFRA